MAIVVCISSMYAIRWKCKERTNDSGKDENGEELEPSVGLYCGKPAFVPPVYGGGEAVGVPNFPIFFNHPKIDGSLPSTHLFERN